MGIPKNLEGCYVIRSAWGGGGGMADSSISADLFQDGNEAEESLCTFACVSPANVTSNYGTNVLMGM